MQSKTLNAAIIIIGNEILSGKTQDLNVQFIAKELGLLGIRLKEVRVIADIEADIIRTVNELRQKYTYVFTTGGIGPTHDDITSSTIAKAFGDEYILHPEAAALYQAHLVKYNRVMNKNDIRMAYMPKSAVPLINRESGAPGFKIENVFVMAGVPSIMQIMFNDAKRFLEVGKPIISKAVDAYVSESAIATEFSELQNKYPAIEMGSYPFEKDGKWGTNLVLRGDNQEQIDHAMQELLVILASVK